MRTVYLVYQDSNYNDAIALFFDEVDADAYIAAALPAIREKVQAQIVVPFYRFELIPVNPM